MRQPSRSRSLAAALVVVTIVVGVSGCGSDSDDEGSAATTEPTTTGAASADESTTGSSSGEANPGTETLVDGPADDAHTVTYTADGSWEPATLEVAPGQVFTFVAADGAPVAAVTFNGNDTYTITSGLTESFTLETPGTYTVKEHVTGTPMTVTVTG